jgi:hypothetical protein
MKRVLFDLNVVLDVLLDREPYVEASSRRFRGDSGGSSTVFF